MWYEKIARKKWTSSVLLISTALSVSRCGFDESAPTSQVNETSRESKNENLNLTAAVTAYPAKMTVSQGTMGTDQPLSALSKLELTGTQDNWNAYRDFWPNSIGHTSTWFFNVPTGDISKSLGTLKVNYMGWGINKQKWTFEVYEPALAKWILIGDNKNAGEWVWSVLSYALPKTMNQYASNGQIRIRYKSPQNLENSFIDFASLTFAADPVASPTPTPTTSGRLYGVTLDTIENLSPSLTSLGSLAKRPTTRVVFDEGMPATYYDSAVRQIASKADVMGELLDSYYVKDYSLSAYQARATEYLDQMGDVVKIWEVGNEINGEWLGTPSTVIPKLKSAYDLAKARGKVTAITLFHNVGCLNKPENEIFYWAQNYIPTDMKNGLDYVLVSYYDDDCPRPRPNWDTDFERLGTIFPNAKLGFGEVGTRFAEKKLDYLNYFYKLTVNHPRYVGGYFWWYFHQDMVPNTTDLFKALNSIWSSQP